MHRHFMQPNKSLFNALFKVGAVFLFALLIMGAVSTSQAQPILPAAELALAPDASVDNSLGTWFIPSLDRPLYGTMRAAGAKWARVAINWRATEPSPGVYSWADADARVSQLKSQGYDIVLAVMHNPTWAADTDCGPIREEHLPTFATFMKKVVQRYSKSPYNVRYYEMGNEPDNGDVTNFGWIGGCWGKGPDPAPGAGGAAYAKMLKAVYPAMKSANSSILVAIGGLSYESWTTEGGPYDPNFLDDVLKAGGGNYFDVINFHFYEAFTVKWGSIARKGWHLQAKVRGYTGTTKPLMVTEVSTPSKKPSGTGDPNTYSEEWQARFVIKGMTQAMSGGIYPIIWFQAVDRPENSGGYSYGLLRSNGSPKPSYYAFKALTSELKGFSYRGAASGLGSAIEGYEFTSGSRKKIVLWRNAGSAINQAFSLSAAGGRLRVVTKSGAVSVITDGQSGDLDGSRNGRVTISVGPDPIIVEPNAASGQNITQEIYLPKGWNLMSYRVQLSNQSLSNVLKSINGHYTRVLGEYGSYDRSVPASFNTLKEMVPGAGYWIYTNRNTTAKITGPAVAATSPIALHQGWNWIGFLPGAPQSVTHALASINGKYRRIIGDDGTYDTSVPPSFNTLSQLRPGKGYLIFMKQAATLTYPASAAAASSAEKSEGEALGPSSIAGTCPPVGETFAFTEVFGFIKPGAPVGAVVTAISPRNDIVGCFVVTTPNQYGIMRVYGEDAANGIPGMRPGETVRFKVDGVLATGSLTWQDDKTPHQVDLTVSGGSTPTPGPTPTPGATSTPTPTPAPTPTPPTNVWRFRGCTYAGEPILAAQNPDQAPCPNGEPLAGVTLNLYGWDEGQPEPGDPFATKVTGSDGFYNFFITAPPGKDVPWDYFRLEAVADGMTNVALWTEDGVFVDNRTVEWATPAAEVHLSDFYLVPAATLYLP